MNESRSQQHGLRPALAAAGLFALLSHSSLAVGQEPAAADPCCQPRRWCWPFHGVCLHRARWPMSAYSSQAAATVASGLAAQVQNGEAVEMTLWNHNFKERAESNGPTHSTFSDKLHPSGLALLHRAARRYAQVPNFTIRIQTAHDIEFTPDQLDVYAHDVDELDAQRVVAVKDYLAKVLRRPDARVVVHDPPVVGMPSEEMKAAYENMIRYGPRSVLETVDPEIRPLGSYAAPPGFIFGPQGLIPLPGVYGNPP